MVQIDIITGFLGSGKTTFIKKYANYLTSQNQRICIIENDFGAINIDTLLLNEMQSDLCNIEMVIGGDVDCHKRRLKTKLVSMAMLGYKRIVLEPSGIFDVEEMMDLLYESPLDSWYELGNIITIVDANIDENLSDESAYLLTSQIAKAGKIVLSKVENQDTSKIVPYLNTLMDRFMCNRHFSHEVIAKNWDEFTNDDYEEILKSGYVNVDHVKLRVLYDHQYTTLFYMNPRVHLNRLLSIVPEMLKDDSLGNIIRIKGCILEEGSYHMINATVNEFEHTIIDQGQCVLIVIGENLIQAKIEEYFK